MLATERDSPTSPEVFGDAFRRDTSGARVVVVIIEPASGESVVAVCRFCKETDSLLIVASSGTVVAEFANESVAVSPVSVLSSVENGGATLVNGSAAVIDVVESPDSAGVLAISCSNELSCETLVVSDAVANADVLMPSTNSIDDVRSTDSSCAVTD